MPNRANIIDGLKICEKYDPNGYICAEHDEIFVLHEADISLEDQAALTDLGFLFNEDTSSWSCFV